MRADAFTPNPDDLVGVYPRRYALVISTGAGSGAQNAVGTGVRAGW